MCFTNEQAKELIKEFKLDQETLVDVLSEAPGSMFGYGPEDFNDKTKRKEVVATTLEAIASNIRKFF